MTVKQEWENFSDMVVPKDAPPVQRIEMRRSFYAGFVAALFAQHELSTLKNLSAEEVEKARLELLEECVAFANEVTTPGSGA